MTHFYHPLKCATQHLCTLDQLFGEIVPKISQNVPAAGAVAANDSVAAQAGADKRSQCGGAKASLYTSAASVQTLVCTLLIGIDAISHANLMCLHYINAGVYVSSGSLSGMAVSG